ncbi:MAG: hypothetical protein ACI9J3_001407, partial [Parvicellaceae bacterium]
AGALNVGFMPATSTTNAVSPGQGLWVWCGDDLTGTSAFTIDVAGPPNTGSINLPLTYTNTGNASDGWNMAANPYPSTMDWDSPNISKTNINNAIYIWNPDLEQFASYVGGIGTNGGSNNIASSQGFWVQANSIGAAIQVTEASKTTVDATFIKQASAVPLRIKTSNAYGADELVINFEDNASASFDAMYDAEKVPSSNINLPLTSSVVNGTDCSINQLNYQERDIPIKILCGITGTHIIQIENGLDFTSSSSCLFLEDLFTGISYDLSEIDSFSTTIYDSTQTARFLLHIGAQVDIIQTDADCFGNASASIIYSKNSNSPFDITWKDNLNNIIAFNSSVNSIDSITNLVPRTYFIESTDAICGNRIDTVIVQQPDEIITQFICDIDTVYLGSGGTINFTNQSVNGNSYLWDFGDFNSSVLFSPVHQYSYAGIYNVTLNTYQNLLCSKEATKEIVVLEQNTIENNAITPNIWINNNDLIITGDNLDRVEIRNAVGQLLIESHSLSNTMNFLNLGNLNSQVLLVSIFSKNKGFTSKIVFIKN